MLRGDFAFTSNAERIRDLKILGVFTAGSTVGLVTLSHLLTFVLKHYKNVTTASIIGLISGSLGVVWTWKATIYKVDEAGVFLLDSNNKQIIQNYKRMIPDFANSETWIAIFYILVGISIVLALDWYGKRTKNV
jgi:uncharacterized membrane protein